MKNLKRALAVLVVVTMMISTVAFASFSDVKDGASVANAVNVGVGLNLFKGYEDGTFKPEGDITRAEFAAIVVRALGQEAQANGAKGKTAFTDVKIDDKDWASGYINIVTRLGIVNGYGDGTFGPEDKVLYEQAIKMIVVALGYTPAIGAAGYPVGYLTKAGELGITSGVAGSNGVAANRGTVAQLIFNALDVPIMQQTGYGTNLDYVVQDSFNGTTRKTLMSENLDVVKVKVNVVEYSITSKEEKVSTKIKDNYKSKYGVNSTDTFFKGATLDIAVGTTDIASFVGANAIVYVKYDDTSSDNPIAVFVAKDTKTDEITLKTSQDVIAKVTDGVTTVKYLENATDTKTQSIDVKAGSAVYVNGQVKVKAGIDLTNATLVTEVNKFYGDATFSLLGDASSNYDYDTVFITTYTDFVVEKLNTTTMRVSSKNAAGSIAYDPTDSKIKATLLDAKGVAMKWADLKEFDLLSVKTSETSDNTVITVAKLLDTKVTGSVSEINNADEKVTVSGKEYETYKAAVFNDMVVGNAGTFLIDQFGKIAYFNKETTASSNYAYIIAVSPSTSSFTDGVEMKLFNAKGEVVIATTASKVKLDGITIDSKNLVTPAVAAVYNTATPPVLVTPAVPAHLASTVNITDIAASTSYTNEHGKTWYTMSGDTITEVQGLSSTNGAGNLITYATNTSNEITAIARPYTVETAKTDYNSYFTKFNDKVTTSKYYADTKSLVSSTGSRVYIKDSSVVIVAPSDSTDSDDYSLFNVASLEDEQTVSNVSFYNVDVNKIAGCVVIQTKPEIGAKSIGVASSYTSTLNASGEDVYNVTLFKDGASKVLTTDKTLSVSDLPTKGLAYKVLVNAKGDVTDFIQLTAFGTNAITVTKDVTDANTDKADNTRYFYGKIKEISGSNVSLYTSDVTTNDSGKAIDGGEFTVPGTANVYVYDTRASKSNMVKVSDISVVDVAYVSGTTSTYADSAKNDIASVSIIAREYKDDIVDVVIYIFEKTN